MSAFKKFNCYILIFRLSLCHNWPTKFIRHSYFQRNPPGRTFFAISVVLFIYILIKILIFNIKKAKIMNSPKKKMLVIPVEYILTKRIFLATLYESAILGFFFQLRSFWRFLKAGFEGVPRRIIQKRACICQNQPAFYPNMQSKMYLHAS